MTELEDANDPVGRSQARERWHAMQSAYEEYVRAHEVYDKTRESPDRPTGLENLELELLDCRRDAFVRYLETRLEYLEGRFDEGYPVDPARGCGPTREVPRLGGISRLVAPKWLILAFAAGFVSVIAFSFGREQEQVRELDTARDQLLASVSATRAGLQLLTKTIEARQSAERSAVRQVEVPPQPAAPAPHVEPRKPSSVARWRHLPQPIANTASHAFPAHNYFSLSRSSPFKRVGPIQVALKSVDMKRNSVDVSIVSESGQVDVQRLRLNQPVRIKSSYHGKMMERVVDHITATGLSGHLIELRG